MTLKEKSLALHEQWGGKLEIALRAPANTREDLSVAYTPGVAEPCRAIAADPALSYKYTRRHNTVAVITDGTAVLGLGDIGPEAGMPVMEGKCLLFKQFANIDAIPLCLRTKDTDEVVKTIALLAGSFGGINLEDISAPRCFEIEKKLQALCDIPVFHDDQHGTAIVVAAALQNALRLAEKSKESVRLVINGAGAAGLAIAELLLSLGYRNLTLCDRSGAIYAGAPSNNPAQEAMAQRTNRKMLTGSLSDVIAGADVFIGVSGPGALTKEMVATMAEKAIVFAMANPTPEILPDEALAAGAYIVGTGRSDFPNQINNLLAFPGVFRGALDVRASVINQEMRHAAVEALANCVPNEVLSPQRILPDCLDKAVVPAVAAAVAQAARNSGVARV